MYCSFFSLITRVYWIDVWFYLCLFLKINSQLSLKGPWLLLAWSVSAFLEWIFDTWITNRYFNPGKHKRTNKPLCLLISQKLWGFNERCWSNLQTGQQTSLITYLWDNHGSGNVTDQTGQQTSLITYLWDNHGSGNVSDQAALTWVGVSTCN